MSEPGVDYGAPSLGPNDRTPTTPRPDYGLAWDDITPASWRAFGEPPKENPPMSDPTPQPTQDRKYAGNYNPQPTPTPQQPNQQK